MLKKLNHKLFYNVPRRFVSQPKRDTIWTEEEIKQRVDDLIEGKRSALSRTVTMVESTV
jgi:hypothetical protein